MAHFDAASAECLVFTYKEGLLSLLAHDLKIRVTRFSLDGDEQPPAFTAVFDARSLRVIGAMENGVDAPQALSAANKREIEQTIVREVLEAQSYPEIRFAATAIQAKTASTFVVKGRLTLHGRTRAVTARVRRDGGSYVGEARLHQTDFGIRPYSAMFGTLKVKPDVLVRITVPA